MTLFPPAILPSYQIRGRPIFIRNLIDAIGEFPYAAGAAEYHQNFAEDLGAPCPKIWA